MTETQGGTAVAI